LFRGALAINNLNQLTSGNLVMGAANGALILDGVAWSDLMANRSGGWGTGANQFQIGGGARFGARTAPLLIQDSGLDAAGVNTNNYFDRSFGIGAPHQKGGAFYANQPVTLDTDTRFTDCRTIEMAGAGPGFNGTHGTGLVHTITADLSDGGPALRGGVKITASPSTYSEVILAGANTWTGSHGTDANSIGSVVSRHFCGLGGLMTSGNTQPVFTTFASPASLPTGNAGNTAYLSAFNRSGGISGYLVTAAPGGAVYDTGTNLNWAFGSNIQAVLGSTGLTGDSASLEGSNVLIHSDLVGGSQNLSLLVRGGVLELGAAGNPLRFVPVTGNDTNATPITRSQPATTYTDATGTRTLIKRGSGTLILENIAYTTMDGSGDTSGQFLWQIGSGSNAVYDGAVRVPPIGTGDNSNSLENYNISLLGGVLESSGTFSRSLGTAANQVQWPNNTAGGGFSAYGGDLTVDLNNPGPDTFVWATTALFPRVNAPLIFGSATADATVRWSDNINLNNAARTVWVMRGTGTAPEADIQGLLSNGSLVKTGAGVLALSAPNTYAGGTTISDGTLRVANITGSAVGTGDVLINGGTLAGDGIVGLASNAANISFGANGGAISPGPTTAILTVYGNVNFTSAGATSLQIELNDATAGSGYDQLNIFGAVTLADATLNLTWMPGFTPTPGTTFTLIDNDLDDAVAGSFLDLPDGTEYLGGSINWRIDYDGGSGNDVVLTILAPIPEPASAALLALAGAALLRRRRQALPALR